MLPPNKRKVSETEQPSNFKAIAVLVHNSRPIRCKLVFSTWTLEQSPYCVVGSHYMSVFSCESEGIERGQFRNRQVTSLPCAVAT